MITNAILHNESNSTLKAQLSAFELGQFLLKEKRVDGKWIDYVIQSVDDEHYSQLSILERFILFDAPITQATKHRFKIFRQLLQERLQNNIKIASIASSLASVVLSLNYSQINTYQIACYDCSEEANHLAKQKVMQSSALDSKNFTFNTTSMWNIKEPNSFDLIESNGLNIYMKDQAQLITLYKQLFNLIKPKGWFIGSAMTPEFEWLNLNHNEFYKKITLQKRLYNDIIQVEWNNNLSSNKTKELLMLAGFSTVQIYPDKHNMFPTFLAYKG